MKFKYILLVALFASLQIEAREWYVTGKGNDANDGKTEQTALRTLQFVADRVNPGDVVLIGEGTYTSDHRDGVLRIMRSGTKDAWITWKAIKGQYPVIHPTNWAGIRIQGSYHVIDGLRIIGLNDSLCLKNAIADLKGSPTGMYNTNGIFVEGRDNAVDQKPHHIVIRNCEVGKCGGGGITGIECDYLTVEDCEVHDNAWYMRYAGSGITTLNLWKFDDEPGYHIIIQRNKVWNNRCLVSWEKTGKLSDGNGILLDVTNRDGQTTTNPDGDAIVETAKKKAINPANAKRPVWNNRSLIANNISVYNGGSGIHCFRTAHVDIINNTAYWNGSSVDYAEIFSNNSYDVTIKNNIMVPRPGGRVTDDFNNRDNVWEHNQYPQPNSKLSSPTDVIAEPMFVNPYIDLHKADFTLRGGFNGLGANLR